MSRHPKLEEFEIETKPDRRFGQKKFSEHIYDPNTGTFLGRTAESWGKILLFYTIFYAVLIALFAVCMATFLQHFINPRVPRLQQERSLIGTSPGLGYRPHPPDVRSTLIWYKGTQYESYEYWERQLIDFLSDYKKKGQTAGVGANIFNCGYDSPPPPGKVCNVDIRGWEPCIEEAHFSFHKSSPCIFLKLNKIYGWRPEFYNDTRTLPDDMPTELKAYINKLYTDTLDKKNISLPHSIERYNVGRPVEVLELNQVWVSCRGETPADEESIGPVAYIPTHGFPGYFFPYNNAEGYLSPLVAIHLQRPKTGIVINIECRAWARNLKYDRRDGLGVVHFEIMIE